MYSPWTRLTPRAKCVEKKKFSFLEKPRSEDSSKIDEDNDEI